MTGTSSTTGTSIPGPPLHRYLHPAVWTERGATTVDLDFDVIVWSDAKGHGIELVDADEFEEHRIVLDYPDELVSEARRAAIDIFERVRTGLPPFGVEQVRPWLDHL